MSPAKVLDLMIEDPRWDETALAERASRAVATALQHLSLSGPFEVTLLACDDARIQALNADFRAADKPTNVLSWPSAERGAPTDGAPPAPPEPGELGDIALAYDTCAREAAAAGKSLADHATHLVVHGLLHCLGYDHERDGDAALMEGLETEILGNLGIEDPYRLD